MGTDAPGIEQSAWDNTPKLCEEPLDGWPHDLAAVLQRVGEDNFVLKLRGTETVLMVQFQLLVGKKIDVNDGAKP